MQGRITKLAEQALERYVACVRFYQLLYDIWSHAIYCDESIEFNGSCSMSCVV